MYMFENGDRCPCCGQTLEGKSRDWLELFSQTVHALGLDPGPQFRIPEPLKLRHLTPSPFLSAAKPPADEMERIIQDALDKAFERVGKEGDPHA